MRNDRFRTVRRLLISTSAMLASTIAVSQPIGFASLNGGTTGGAGGSVVKATTGTEIHEALCGRASSSTPIIIQVEGTINHGNTSKVSGSSCSTADDKIEIKSVSNISIIGVGKGALFDELGIHLRDASNIILQNLHVRDVKKSGSPTSNGGDAIGMESDVSNVWADHLTLEASGDEGDGYDALFDMKANTKYVTLSYSILRNSGRGGLVGSSDSDTENGPVTFHHNYYENLDSRVPLLRGATAHSFNNYYNGINKSGINPRIGGEVKVENNYFENAKDPLGTFYTNDLGYWEVRGNIWGPGVTWSEDGDSNHPAGPNPVSTTTVQTSYTYSLDDASCVKDIVTSTAGAGTKLAVSDGSCDVSSPTPTPPPQTDGTVAIRTSVSGANVTLSWSYTGFDAVNQQIYRDTDADPDGRVRIAGAVEGSTFTDSGLSDGVYYYWIKSRNAADVTINSNAASAAVGVDDPDSSVQLSASVSGSNVNLTWSYTNFDASGQEVYRDTDSDPSGRVRIASGVTGNSYTDSGVSSGVYYYWVKSRNSDDIVINSNAAEASVGSTEPGPVGSSSLGTSVSGSTVNLSWTYSDFEPVNQQIYRDTDADLSGRVRIAGSVTGNSYADTGVSAGVYYYSIKSTNSDGDIINSEAVKATVSASGGGGHCKAVGWATRSGRSSTPGTITGGGDAEPVVVTTFADLEKYAGDSSARVIHIDGTLGGGWSGRSGDRLKVGSNKTIIGLRPGTRLKAPIHIKDSTNVIIRNIVIKGPGSDSEQAWDNLNIEGSSKNIWIDHSEFWDGQDGNADVVKGADNVTFTWNIFGYTTDGGHNFSNLVASSDNEPQSEGKLNITLMFNHFKGVAQRQPRCRYGNIHVVNNLFTKDGMTSENTISAGKECRVLVENNHFIGVKHPVHKREGGKSELRGRNIFEDTTGDTEGNGGTAFDPPYDYDEFLVDASEVEGMLQGRVGATLTNPSECQ